MMGCVSGIWTRSCVRYVGLIATGCVLSIYEDIQQNDLDAASKK